MPKFVLIYFWTFILSYKYQLRRKWSTDLSIYWYRKSDISTVINFADFGESVTNNIKSFRCSLSTPTRKLQICLQSTFCIFLWNILLIGYCNVRFIGYKRDGFTKLRDRFTICVTDSPYMLTSGTYLHSHVVFTADNNVDTVL